jgi:hypothetical protein
MNKGASSRRGTCPPYGIGLIGPRYHFREKKNARRLRLPVAVIYALPSCAERGWLQSTGKSYRRMTRTSVPFCADFSACSHEARTRSQKLSSQPPRIR